MLRIRTCCKCSVEFESSTRCTYCLDCKREYNRVHYAKNKDEIRSKQSTNTAIEKRKQWRAEYLLENKDKAAASIRDWRERNPEKIAAYGQKADVKRRASIEAFKEIVNRNFVYERDQGICQICNTSVDATDYHIDHVVPLSRGGTHCLSNVQLAHPSCNAQKWAHVNYQPKESFNAEN